MNKSEELIFSIGKRWPASIRRPVDGLLGLSRLDAIYRKRPRDVSGLDFLEWALGAFGVKLDVDSDERLNAIPKDGPLLVVSNHPFGGIEGIVLGWLLGRRRPDTRILANYLLGRIPELREMFLTVDPFEGQAATQRNVGSLRKAIRWISRGRTLVVFPAGEVAHLRASSRRVEEPAWNPGIGGLVRRTGCTVVPVFFGGRNGNVFQAIGLVHPYLRTAWLARALAERQGTTLDIRVGSPVTPERLRSCSNDRETIEFLRRRTMILGERGTRRDTPVQPRKTPSAVQPIIGPVALSDLVAEVERLEPDQRLIESEGYSVYTAAAHQIPRLLREIGRLREWTFREVGEGTGREVDLDRFDEHYDHLFVWSHVTHEVIGAYRLGRTDAILRNEGLDGLYTSSLFAYRSRLFEAMGPAIELGRSFVRPDYQKSYSPLMLLWKGISRYVSDRPQYPILFGPVSVSADYRSASQRLIVSFLRQNSYAHDWARWVRPRSPWRQRKSAPLESGLAQLRTLDDVSRFISEIESDSKGVPILLKQYLKLGGRLLGFNVDPEFSNVLDVLLMVDLRQTKRRILQRYMGREGIEKFHEFHDRARSEAG